MMERKPLELYIHIPFCRQKCLYCDFLSGPSTSEEQSIYMRDLCDRISKMKAIAGGYRLTSIFVGGGTPSVIEAPLIGEMWSAVHRTFQMEPEAEITVEVNPESVTVEKLDVYRQYGVNRLSIGLQSANNEELRKLGRIHTYEMFCRVYEKIRKKGFDNVNIDLMSGLPGQSPEGFEETLKTVVKLEPEHISAYSLIIEEGTPFYTMYGPEALEADRALLLSEDEDRALYRRTKEILHECGYERYEISNYAKPGYECRHNLGYWDRAEYLGIGSGAASLMDHTRWVQDGERQMLTQDEEMEEFMFLGLRKMSGVSRTDFFRYFGKSMEEVYGSVIGDMENRGLLTTEGDRVYLTRRGIDISNYVMSGFLL